MNEIIQQLHDNFTTPFRAQGCTLTDSKGYVLCTLSTCVIGKEQGAKLAQLLADTLNKDE